MTVYAWIEYGYYDGLLTFSQLVVRLDPGSPAQSAKVRWLDSVAEKQQ